LAASLLGAVADIHGNFDALRRAMMRHPDVAHWVCVGDLASRSGEYPNPPAPLFWIKGNNENFDRIAEWESGQPQPEHLHYIRNGTAVDVGPVRVAGLGGTFAPTWFDTPAARLPHTPRDDRRRHFVREEADACARLSDVDVLMTHEAPRPFIVVDEAPGRVRRRDAGKPAINQLLAALRPRLHLCGHHHRFAETDRDGVRSVCIDRINRSYLLIDTGSYDYQLVENGEES
jgi:Icc-related predicted phosphoesterase